MSKKYVLWFHYNKPASQQAKQPQISVHFRNKCHILDDIKIKNVESIGKVNKRQPHYVRRMRVEEDKFFIHEGVAYVGDYAKENIIE